ncbi:MAG: DMT family protein [Elusimicrobia bacterium]|nr:DMT family protein [Elusimicrobiota bacterium]
MIMYKPLILLIISNIFMTFAWYGHLKFKDKALWLVILVSWLIAFVEYCFQVPANRIGHAYFSAAQLKGMQEVITLVVFALFSIFYLKENLRWNHYAGFVLLVLSAVLIFKK